MRRAGEHREAAGRGRRLPGCGRGGADARRLRLRHRVPRRAILARSTTATDRAAAAGDGAQLPGGACPGPAAVVLACRRVGQDLVNVSAGVVLRAIDTTGGERCQLSWER